MITKTYPIFTHMLTKTNITIAFQNDAKILKLAKGTLSRGFPCIKSIVEQLYTQCIDFNDMMNKIKTLSYH